MHYNEHLGKQAISFLRKLMRTYGSDKHQMPEYFEEYFFTFLEDYKSLNSLLMCDYKEGASKMKIDIDVTDEKGKYLLTYYREDSNYNDLIDIILEMLDLYIDERIKDNENK